MNRGIDYRSDFYSLGVTFYELLTGQLPFISNDPMELVHCHLAKTPIFVHQLIPENPLVLSEIISKLMAKNAENRYQSALGIKHDLEICLHQIQINGKIESFELGERDISDRFTIPEKLYGREKEVEELLAAFERVSKGNTELMLVAGFSGIGKTAVVNEVHKPIVKQRGYFIKGKFDQFNRNIPFSAFVQAFRDLMGQLIVESDAQIQQWKSKIIQALGDNTQVIVDVIPELVGIIGQQPPATELSGTAAQNRFNLLFQKFVQVFTNKEHPLVIFLDDLQWADLASLQLIQLLMSDTSQGYLLLIGAYRDNEVSPAHPLILTLDGINKIGAIINTITLQPLSHIKLNQLVADTLKCAEDLAFSLSELIHRKTQGNPFFATQFLKSLHQDRLIEFNWSERCWQCDISQINQQTLTDDVVEFMVLQLRRLPEATQEVLKLAACIGNQFDLQTLAIISEQSEVDVAAGLWKALQSDLILPQSEVYKFYQDSDEQTQITIRHRPIAKYKFLHDRVQQAAYSLIPEEQKQKTHLQIGRLLLHKSSVGDHLFAILNHLNISSSLIIDPDEQRSLIQLNLMGCQRAKASTAYGAAVQYAVEAMKLLPDNPWQTDYSLTLALYESAAEVAYLNTDFDKAEQLIHTIWQGATHFIDQIKSYELLVQIYIAKDQQLKAIETGLDALNKLGVPLIDRTDWKENLPQLLDHHTLATQPEMTNPAYLAALRILITITPPTHHIKPELFPAVVLTMVELCDREGYSGLAAYTYGIYGLFLCALIEDIETAYRSGKLSLTLLEQFQARDLQTKVNMLFAVFVCACKESGHATLPLLKQGIEVGFQVGDIEYVSYCIMAYFSNLFLLGQPFNQIDESRQIYILALEQFKQEHCIEYSKVWLQVADEFIGAVASDAAPSAEFSTLQHFEATHNHQCLFALHLTKLISCYTFEHYALALDHATKALESQEAAFGVLLTAAHNFYYSLTLLAMLDRLNPEQDSSQREAVFEQIRTNQTKLQQLAEHAPSNYLHKFDLVASEQHRALGQKSAAIELYDSAISGAKANGYIQEEALANELAAKFYLDWGKQKVAASYMQEAYYCYAKWGAKAKTDDLEKRYPELLKPILQQQKINLNPIETIAFRGSFSSTQTPTTANTSISDILDFTSILKATQAISSSIELDELLANFTHIILENSGAKKAALLLRQDDTWEVKVITSIEDESNSQNIQTILDPQSLEHCQDVPVKVINYVKNTQQTIVINDCKTDIPGVIGEYMHRTEPQSVLCTPIINQGHLVGILYLENKLTSGVFTSDRLNIINLLCTQAAISLENAQLYNHLQDSKAQFQRLADNAPGMIYQFQLSPDGISRFNYVSSGCYEIYEIPPEQIVADSRSVVSVLHPEDVAHYAESVGTSAQTLEPWLYEGRIITPSGKQKWIQCASRPIKQADGTIIWDGLLLDVTERKQAEAAVLQTSQELKKALEDLQQTQLQMIQSEKMSALGNLVAGVAHEMNNPLGFISVSLEQAKPTIADITQHLKLYQEIIPNPSDEIINHAEEIDLEYTLEDLPNIINSMVIACDRLKNISTSLRTFSRADQDYKVPFDIHEGIDSTILILKHRLKANEQRPPIEVITEYGKLPQVQCFPGQLNQVFMNILANAIDALEESDNGRSFEEIKANPNKITIKTSVENNQVNITIADNGKGMSEEIKQKIFDHLFTTKSVGKGTGLGLAITQQIIIEKHGGNINVNSTLGQGTDFIIQLPI